jgi:hypothetical protein
VDKYFVPRSASFTSMIRLPQAMLCQGGTSCLEELGA